jgi:hypothetical protein
VEKEEEGEGRREGREEGERKKWKKEGYIGDLSFQLLIRQTGERERGRGRRREREKRNERKLHTYFYYYFFLDSFPEILFLSLSLSISLSLFPFSLPSFLTSLCCLQIISFLSLTRVFIIQTLFFSPFFSPPLLLSFLPSLFISRIYLFLFAFSFSYFLDFSTSLLFS